MPKRWCSCTGCAACGVTSGTHGVLFDMDATRTLRCPGCQQHATARRNTRPNDRGYDGEYQRNRPAIVAQGRSGRPCCICGRPFTEGQKITAEHIKPLRDGGTSELANLAPAHSECNTGWNRGKRGRTR